MPHSSKKRTPLQRKTDIAYIIQLLRMCRTENEVTEELNKARKNRYTLSRQQVNDDIKLALQQIMDRNTANTLQARVLAAERQLLIAQEARDEYTRSRHLDQIKRITEESKTDDGVNKKTRTETANRLGDPRYLAIMVSALSEHARLLGLYTPPPKDETPFTPNTQINQFAVSVTISGSGQAAPDPFDKLLNDRTTTEGNAAATAAEAKSAADSGGAIRVTPSTT